MGCCIRCSGCVVMETLIYVVLRSLKNLTVQLFRYKEFLQTVIQAAKQPSSSLCCISQCYISPSKKNEVFDVIDT